MLAELSDLEKEIAQRETLISDPEDQSETRKFHESSMQQVNFRLANLRAAAAAGPPQGLSEKR